MLQILLSKNNIRIVIILSIFILLYLMIVHRTDVHTAAIKKNVFSGEISIDTTPGINITAPWILVSRIDITPMRVCIESGSNITNCRLIRFVPSQYEEFINYEGFYYYWWNNRLSFNISYEKTYRGVVDLLRIHGYSDNPPSFVEVLDIASQ